MTFSYGLEISHMELHKTSRIHLVILPKALLSTMEPRFDGRGAEVEPVCHELGGVGWLVFYFLRALPGSFYVLSLNSFMVL